MDAGPVACPPSLYASFLERKDAFFATLERVVSAMSYDEYAKQMFRDQLSKAYVPDRICEVIKGMLKDDREKLLSTQMNRLKMIEICIGSDRMNLIEQVGQEISQPGKTDEEKRQIIETKLTNIIVTKNHITRAELASLRSLLSNEINSAKSLMQQYKTDITTAKLDAEQQLKQSIANTDQIAKQLSIKTAEAEKLAQENHQMEDAITQLISKSKKKQKHARRMIASLNEEVETRDAALLKLKGVNRSLKETAKQMSEASSGQVSKISDEAAALRRQIDELKDKNREMSESLHRQESLALELQDAKRINIEMTAKCQKFDFMEQELRRVREQNIKLKAKLDASSCDDRQIKALSEQNEKLLGVLSAHEERIRVQDAAYRKQKEKFRSALQTYQEHCSGVDSLTQENEALREMVRELRQEQKNLSSIIETSVSESPEKTNVVRLKRKIRDYEEIVRDHEVTIAKLTDQLKENASLREKIDAHQHDVSEQKNRAELFEAKAEKYKSKLDQVSQELTRRTDEVDDLKHLRDTNEKLQRENHDLTQELSEMTEKLAQCEEKLHKMKIEEIAKRNEESKELNDARSTIEKLLNQTSRICDVNKLDDIPKAVGEWKKQFTKANTIIERIKESLQVKENEEIIPEIRQIRQRATEAAEFQREIELVAGIQSLQACTKHIVETRTRLDELEMREKHMCEVLGIDSPSKILKQIGKQIKTAKHVKDFYVKLQADNEVEAAQKFENVCEFFSIVSDHTGCRSIEALKKFLEKHSRMEKREAEIMKYLAINSPKNLETAVESLLKKMSDYESVKESLNMDGSIDRVSELSIADYVCQQLCKRLELESNSEIIPTVNELLAANTDMNDIEEQIMLQLTVLEPEQIMPRLHDMNSKLAEHEALIESICQLVGASTETEILQCIRSLIDARRDLSSVQETLQSDSVIDATRSLSQELDDSKQMTADIVRQLGVASAAHISGAINGLLADRSTLRRISTSFPSRFKSANPEENVSQCLTELASLESLSDSVEAMLQCRRDGVRAAVAEMTNGLARTKNLVSHLLSLLSIPSSDLSIPVDEFTEARINKALVVAQKRLDREKAEIELIMNKALAHGYRGRDIHEAIDAICESANRRLKEVSEELESEQKVHEELMQLLSGKIQDSKLLREKLNAKDAKLVKKAEETMKFIREMKAKKTVMDNLLEQHKQQREELLNVE